MGTHRLTVDISEESYQLLQRGIEAGDFDSEDEAIDVLLTGTLLNEVPQPGDPAFDAWIQNEVIPAYDEAKAHPEKLLTGEQVLEYLAERRKSRNKTSNAA
jgi:hypothetical protein